MIEIQHNKPLVDTLNQTKPENYLKQSSILYASNPPTIIPLVGIPPNSEIIYEINISVPKAKAADYVCWLKYFIQKQCQTTPGFILCNVFSQPKPVGLHWLSEEGDSKCYYTIHFHIRTLEYLKDYLKYKQEKIAKVEIDRFQYNILSRRVLRNIFNTSA
eukprot:jgi/Orpsp1_1/1175166/evm.model.c7180000052856.1